MQRSLVWVIAAAVAVLIGAMVSPGCGSGESTGPTACSSSDDCEAGRACFRSQCLPSCSAPTDCQVGQSCSGGVCVPGSGNACGSAEDCTTPPNACQLAEGAVCNEGVCEYPDVVCDSPEADRCIEDGAILVRSSLPGTCDPQSGACTYAEEEIAVDPENCERIATGGCDAVVCTDPPCASNGTADPDSPACE